MKTTENKNIQKFGRTINIIAFSSLLAQLFILSLFFIFDISDYHSETAQTIILCVIILFWFNVFVSLILFISLLIYRKHWKYILTRIIIQFVNISLLMILVTYIAFRLDLEPKP